MKGLCRTFDLEMMWNIQTSLQFSLHPFSPSPPQLGTTAPTYLLSRAIPAIKVHPIHYSWMPHSWPSHSESPCHQPSPIRGPYTIPPSHLAAPKIWFHECLESCLPSSTSIWCLISLAGSLLALELRELCTHRNLVHWTAAGTIALLYYGINRILLANMGIHPQLITSENKF